MFLLHKVPWFVFCAYSVLVKTNRSSQGGLREQPGRFVLSPGTHKGPVMHLKSLVWEQHLPLHSLLPMKIVFPEFPCSQVLRSTPDHFEGCLVALLEMKCSKKWMMGFVDVGSCYDLCTQVPKQMVLGCSPWAGEGAATDTDNPIPAC